MSKSIRLSDEAYERLEVRRREGETLSEVVLRLAGERSLSELAGVLSEEEADALEDAIEERRERRREQLEAVADRLQET
ncbi:antitoxin VapB family protein [Halorussus salilacus]|uniref:antitoxin VapB family protein n=1 Tax=Halorussus salilacus TaxID=2953750 RepID=UPI00209D0290|nr:antitoxin VapB family protein [Halorussus salilacus]USZ67557.1 antitoxin VapB family protein [Halorussus salilacus]